MKKEAQWALGQASPFLGLGLPLAVIGCLGWGTDPGTLSPCPRGLYKSSWVEREAVAPLVPGGHTPDVPEPSLWTQVAPLPTDTETLARKALVSESPRVDPSPDQAGLAPPGGLPSLQVLTAKARPSCHVRLCYCPLPGTPGGCIWAVPMPHPPWRPSLPVA